MPSRDPSIQGVVLAGGQSRRMGTDKALLLCNGIRLVDRMVSLLKDGGLSRVTICGRDYGHAFIPDVRPELGPLGGLWSLAREQKFQELNTNNQWWLVVPVDMPGLDVRHVELLCLSVESADHVGAGCVRYRGRELPTLIRVTQKLHTTLEEACASLNMQRPPSLRWLQESMSTLEIEPEVAAQNLFVNVNEPAKWKVICEELAQ